MATVYDVNNSRYIIASGGVMAFEIKKVIIKGALPESCGQCWLEEDPDPYPCYCVFDYSRKLVTDWKSRPNWCPLETSDDEVNNVYNNLHL